MTEEEWLMSGDPMPMVEFVKNKTSHRKLRLFAAACCRSIWHLIEGENDRNAVEVAERLADGLASNKERRATQRATNGFVSFALCADISQAVDGVMTHVALSVARPKEFTLSDGASYCEPSDGASYCEWAPDYSIQNPAQCAFLRDIFGNPFHPVAFDPAWGTDTAVSLVRQMYDSREFGAMPILADALQDAGCENSAILNHCRDADTPHVRGCWVVDLLLGNC